MDRSEISRALAKAIAYKECGKDLQAEQWAIKLVEFLECADILRTDSEREVAELSPALITGKMAIPGVNDETISIWNDTG